MNKTENTCLISDKDTKLIQLGLINNLLTELVAVETGKKERIKNTSDQHGEKQIR